MNIPDAKLVVMGMASTGFTIADPTDPGMLDICGFDSAVPELLKEFVLGNIWIFFSSYLCFIANTRMAFFLL